jgi:hypothetical protein
LRLTTWDERLVLVCERIAELGIRGLDLLFGFAIIVELFERC